MLRSIGRRPSPLHTRWPALRPEPGCIDVLVPPLICLPLPRIPVYTMHGWHRVSHSLLSKLWRLVDSAVYASWANQTISNTSAPRERPWATLVCRSVERFADVEVAKWLMALSDSDPPPCPSQLKFRVENEVTRWICLHKNLVDENLREYSIHWAIYTKLSIYNTNPRPP